MTNTEKTTPYPDTGEIPVIGNVDEAIFRFMHAARTVGASLAVWRLPQSENYNIVVNTGPVHKPREIPLEELPTGFMFANYKGEQHYLHADITWSSDDPTIKIKSERAAEDVSHFLSALKQEASGLSFYINKKNTLQQDNYTGLVQKGVKSIEEGLFQKVVPARSRFIPLDHSEKVIPAFFGLGNNYPNAFISFVSTPETGSWLGATPEILVATKDHRILTTVSLAGTQPYQGQELRNVAWTQKEIEEQALVSRYIINCFKKIRLREFEEYGPKTVIAGNLLHLKTEFKVDLKATEFPQLGSVMLGLLHPTSAVCGMPLEPARQFLRENEPFDRKFFSGYLGPVNFNQDTAIFVNLRCMELVTDGIQVYAGAGVTIDSIPEKEVEEIELKFRSVLNIIESL